MPTTPDESNHDDGLDKLRADLLDHALYNSVCSVSSLRLFMREHVFAVWDFMSLLKRLQQIVTCTKVPWLPPVDPQASRFINEIVLGEECDNDGHDGYASHFELYLQAMNEVGADARPIHEFVDKLRRQVPVEQALSEVSILPTTRDFVKSTLRLTTLGQPHEIASAFFHGREDVIPDMFARLVVSLPHEGVNVERLVHYLKRHIELDGDEHGPLASKLVDNLCDQQPQRRIEANAAAGRAVSQRIALWSGVLAEIQRLS
jgi:DUF3050 family protein